MGNRKLRRSDKMKTETIDPVALFSYYASKIPHSDGAELSVITSCLKKPGVAERLVNVLKPSWFYGLYNQEVYKAIRFLARCRQPICEDSVGKELERRGTPLPDGFLHQMIAEGTPSDYYEYQARIIAQLAIVREIMNLSQRYAVVDTLRDCDEIYTNFKQDYQELERTVALKPAPHPSFHFLKPDEKLPFGKYRGYSLFQILVTDGGIEYLEWIEDNVSGYYIDWPAVYEWLTNHISVNIDMANADKNDSPLLGDPVPF